MQKCVIFKLIEHWPNKLDPSKADSIYYQGLVILSDFDIF